MNSKLSSFLKHSYIYLLLFITYLPMLIIVILSFNGSTIRGNVNTNFGTPLPEGVVPGQGYVDLMKSDFLIPFLNSLIIGIVVTPISVLIALSVSYALWKNKKLYVKSSLNVARFSIINPDIIAGLGLSIVFFSTVIPLGFNFGMFTIILAHLSFCVPYALIGIYPRMMKINPNLILASYDLGYNKTETFFKIVIPHMLPALLSVSAITLTISFDDFIITNMVRGSTQTLSSQLYLMRKGIKTWAVSFGALTILILISVIGIFSIRTYFKERQKSFAKYKLHKSRTNKNNKNNRK